MLGSAVVMRGLTGLAIRYYASYFYIRKRSVVCELGLVDHSFCHFEPVRTLVRNLTAYEPEKVTAARKLLHLS